MVTITLLAVLAVLVYIALTLDQIFKQLKSIARLITKYKIKEEVIHAELHIGGDRQAKLV